MDALVAPGRNDNGLELWNWSDILPRQRSATEKKGMNPILTMIAGTNQTKSTSMLYTLKKITCIIKTVNITYAAAVSEGN